MDEEMKEKHSKYRDLVYYKSSNSTWLNLAMIVDKPEKPSYIVATTHKWNETIPKYEPNDSSPSKYLYIHINMRGRKYSDGTPDFNGFELIDIVDAIDTVKKLYSDLIIDPEIVYFEGSDDDGGCALELISKFPDYFSLCISKNGVSNITTIHQRKLEYKNEFDKNVENAEEETFASRSAIKSVKNLSTPLCLITTISSSIPSSESVNYKKEAGRWKKAKLVEHHSNVKEEDIDKIVDDCIKRNVKPVEVPQKGKMIVPGYLVTKKFNVFLRDINKMAVFEYDLDKGKYHVECDAELCYTIRFPMKRHDFDD